MALDLSNIQVPLSPAHTTGYWICKNVCDCFYVDEDIVMPLGDDIIMWFKHMNPDLSILDMPL